MIKLKNILAENMRRFKTKNLNENIISSYDEKTMTLSGERVTVIDAIVELTAKEANDAEIETETRLLTIDEIVDYVNQTGLYTDDDRFPTNEQNWRVWVYRDMNNPDSILLWDLKTNKEAPSALLATRYMGIVIPVVGDETITINVPKKR